MMTGLLVWVVTLVAGHFGCASLVPFILRGLGIARGVLSATSSVRSLAKPTAPRPDTNVGHMVITDPQEQAWLAQLRAKSAASQAPPKPLP